MERTIVAWADRSARPPAAAAWAAREARLRALPLRVVHGSQPDTLDEAKMVVLGIPAEGGAADLTPGSTALALVEASACPVVLVPDDPAGADPTSHRDEVTLGVDARDPAEEAIDFAFETARVRGVRLHAVHAWRFPSCATELPFGIPEEDRGAWEDHEVQLLANALRPWREKYPDVRVLEDVVLFTPAQALLRRSATAALLVVGQRSGSAAGKVVRTLLPHAKSPVAVVPW